MKKGFVFFLVVSIIFFSNEAIAQCPENLKQAQDNFDDGHLYGIPSLLAECIKKGSKQDRIEAYRLLTLTYLYIDDPIGAEKSFLELLKLDPEYRVDSTNHIELVHLSKEYITTPIVSWRARLGANMSTISVLAYNGPNNTILKTGFYTPSVGYSFIGSLDVHLNKYVNFSLESDLYYNSFRYTDSFFNIPVEPKSITEGQNSKDLVELHEKSWNYSLPITVKLTYPGVLYYPYVYGGYAPSYNIITATDATTTNNEAVGRVFTESKNLNITNLRKPFSHSFIIGIGLMRRVTYNYVFIDVRYKIGMFNRVVKEEQFNLEDPDKQDLNTYLLVHQVQDNFFKQNELNITVGYVWPKYKPRKRRSVTAKSFIGDIFKKKTKDE